MKFYGHANLQQNEIQNAAGVAVTPAGNLTSSDVQAALQELQTDIDGALVGGASLDPDEFARIVQYRLHEEAQ